MLFPIYNMVAAATRLNALPLADGTPFAAETRNAIELLRTAVAQQEKYSYSRNRVHSTPVPGRSYSRRVESPAVSSSEQRRNPLRSNAQAIVDEARARREAAVAAAQQEVCQSPLVIPSASAGAGAGLTSRAVGVPCLIPALRNERLPKDFKGPRKVPNYTADLPPEAWIESYELAMEMLDVSDAVCAKYFIMRSEEHTSELQSRI